MEMVERELWVRELANVPVTCGQSCGVLKRT